ncbi:GntR family transcriptional regulator [Microbacterium sp. BG28]|uniref:GntR family transcriptional regulator n=1 Tax=Microbacterium sp. BG28 TaxID=3097356 RepID=UPI002A59C32C|nr:GntR family transcriptional regulator [Microbacterium sp. BG28]MDY0828269.1 GntR family transcriptional regulator [Microbacterium sp. BG28]
MNTPDDSLVDRISRFIEVQGFGAGERIGAERALAEQFEVSRSELRAALEVLERHHRIRRTIGRSGGVFCWDGKIERHLNTIEGVPDMLRQQGFRVTTTVLHSGIAVATPVECRALRIEAGEPVFRLLRRRDADDAPLSLDSMTLPIRMLPGFQNITHTQSVYRTLLEDYEIEASEANETIDISPATPEQAEVLGITTGDPLLDIRRVTYSQHGVPFEFAHDYFVAARTRITLSRHGARWKRAAEPTRRLPRG